MGKTSVLGWFVFFYELIQMLCVFSSLQFDLCTCAVISSFSLIFLGLLAKDPTLFSSP